MKTIAILDLNESQRNIMTSSLSEWISDMNILAFGEAETLTEWLKSNSTSTALVSLDYHFITLQPEECDLVQYLKSLEPSFPILVHCDEQSSKELRNYVTNNLKWRISRFFE